MRREKKPTTNITKEHRDAFNALTSSEYRNFALFSCFINGEPTAAIVTINLEEDGDARISPLFVAVTSKMKLSNHDGVAASEAPLEPQPSGRKPRTRKADDKDRT